MVLRLPYWSASMGISLCMIVRNGEDWVEGAVQSVRSIVNEVIIVDTGSTDATLERLKPLSIKLLKKSWNDSFAEAAMSRLHLAGASRAISGIGNAPMNPEKRQRKCSSPRARGIGADPVPGERGSSSERTMNHMDVKINDSQINVTVEISTWGDLLDWIETDYLKAGQCITHVYLAENESLNYRDTLVCGKEIAEVTPVAIKSGDFDSVVSESMRDLDHEVKASLESVRQIIRLLENRREEEAYRRLAHLLDSVRIFFTIFSEDLGWIEPYNAEISRKESPAALERALTQLVNAQENHYWVSICDVLEYEIVPILESWQKLVEGTRECIA